MAKTQTFTIPFHTASESKPAYGESDLGQKISQIIDQKGDFRDVTEANLLAEGSGDDRDAFPPDGSSPKTELNLTPEKRTEKLWSSREAMVEQWSRGMDELLTTLDFLSLLISKQSAAARAGMSPGIQSARVPAGSFEPKFIKAPQTLKSKTEQAAGVSRGWKAQGFESASKKFSAASERLKKEAERESQFWSQTASLKSQGWKISRHPRESKAIGIHFGLAESAPNFRDRGFALLTQDDHGKLYLDRTATTDRRKKLRITIEQDGQVIASAPAMLSHPDTENDNNDLAIEARDELLEAEMFHEMSREARLVFSQDVTAQAQSISFTLGQHYKIMLSYAGASSETLVSSQEDELVKCIRLSLIALLLAAHENNRQLRSRAPHALSLRPAISPELAVLRPLITNLRHQPAIKVLQELIAATIVRPLEQAGIHSGLELQPHIRADLEERTEHRSTLLSTDRIQTTFHLVLPSDKLVNVGVVNSMDPPIYGTRYEASGVDFGFARVTAKTYTDLNSVAEALRRKTLFALAELIQTSRSSKGEWKVTTPQRGELAYYPTSAKEAAIKVRIQMQSQNIILRVIPTTKLYDTGKRLLAWSWSATETRLTGDSNDVAIAREGAKDLTFMDVISNLLIP